MKMSALSVCSLVLLWSGAALAQDPVKVDPGDKIKVVFENASVRVLKIDGAPGEEEPDAPTSRLWSIPLAASKVRFTTPDGKSEEATWRTSRRCTCLQSTHSPANVGTGRIAAVLIEFKSPKPGTAALPESREGMAMKVLAEGPRAMAYRSTANPKFQEPAGSKHDFDQVVIALGAAQMSLSIDGKPAKTSWARGDVQFIGRGVPHQATNTGGKPVDFVIVAIK